jgi:hypothetical protein
MEDLYLYIYPNLESTDIISPSINLNISRFHGKVYM